MTTVSTADHYTEHRRTVLKVHSGGFVFDRYLACAPFSHALFRAAEADALAAYPLIRPVLDLGCGAGEFAALALNDKVDAGIDVCKQQLLRAARTGCYLSLHQADARSMPFSNAEFRTVFSLSVLEHILLVNKVVAEVFRVLEPGGRFIGTVVLNDLHSHLYYPNLLRRLGLGCLGRTYLRLHDRQFNHQTLLSRVEWEDLLRQSGFRVVTSQCVVTPFVLQSWDCYLPAAAPYRLLCGLGWPKVWHPRWFRSWASRKARTLLSQCHELGGVLVFVAEKPTEAS
jgi:ubiquinone/menaquinone biosynthesis C-methylase UbiE